MNNFLDHLNSWIQRETVLITDPNPLIVLAALLLTGFVFSRLARKFHIPSVTAQIFGGIIIGHYALNIFDVNAFNSFKSITDFALGFIGYTIGSHLNFNHLHNAGKRIFLITISDVIITPIIVFLTLFYLGNLPFSISLLVAVIAITTAPGSTLHIVKEKRSKGIFTKTLLAVIVINNVLTIFIFYLAYYFLFYKFGTGDVKLLATFGKALLLLLESVIIGGSVGFGLIYITEKRKTRSSFLALVILAIVITAGTSEFLHLSGILSSLVLGVIISNYSRYRKTLFTAFKDIETEVFSLFFVLAGTHLDLLAAKAAGFAGFLFIISRLAGKTIGPKIGSYLAGSTQTIKKNIGYALYPIAGVAIGLILLIENNSFLSEHSSQITAIILTAVVVNELLGPIFTGKAIKNAGEEDKNRLRLMDFLQEEFIKIDLNSTDKWDALNELAEFMYKTHKIDEVSYANLKKSIINREEEISTGIGDNLAIPHAIIDGGPKIRGVIGVTQKGIEWDAIDEKTVNIIFLIATPKGHHELHLHVLANIAKIFGHHPHIKQQIIKAKTPEEVFEILQAEEVEELNPYFED
ncbi:MAG: PTS sugar transporter subunit IIA [Candidatus Cloacimonetes bacterium]|nr:PTS sugar transporter subunit IIA [Candidatus Cloacimonadota bacterium]MCF7814101.1 PTS sugar transporter subunit IIA [Candidatus Cloacimonadota bacterium]MCF7867970.1 PTS sugar transporter subunit IIA [Candidatus Cloacimonadota bacterium]MCF7883428.1 PTS sugar transporter subunit IIA [Candidatus Cloacimonadota bacterium]